ncbi:hypothetical protein HYALB_00013922 [Hymenoscyphus albidus]|uniref:RRM domain-containing protein n=1 Tax=Hymenoscyphus albidus TaxID=595503 RepID=A0A9N9QBW6_9HELO|nr:hypothetical protein HYALB_00013922 [Hymenoscyphus albidus]
MNKMASRMGSEPTENMANNWQDKFTGFTQKTHIPGFIPSWVMQMPNLPTIDGTRKQSFADTISEDSSTVTSYHDLGIDQNVNAPTPFSTAKLERGLGMLRVDTWVENPVAYQYLNRMSKEYYRSPVSPDYQRPGYQSLTSNQPSSMETLFVTENGAPQFTEQRAHEKARDEAERIKALCEKGDSDIFSPSPLNAPKVPWMGNMALESPTSPHSASSAFSPTSDAPFIFPRHVTDRQIEIIQRLEMSAFPIRSHHTRGFVRAPQYVNRDVLGTIEPDYTRGGSYMRQAAHPAGPFQQQLAQFTDNSENCAIIIENISPHTKHCDIFDLIHTGPVSSLKLKPPQPPKHMTMSAFVAFTNPVAAQRLVEMSPLVQHNRKLWVRYNTTNGGTNAIPSLYITRVVVLKGPRDMMSRPWWIQYFNNICNVQWDRYLNLRCDIPGYAALEFRFSRVEQARTCMTHVQNDPVFGTGIIKARFGRDPCDGPGFTGNN